MKLNEIVEAIRFVKSCPDDARLAGFQHSPDGGEWIIGGAVGRFGSSLNGLTLICVGTICSGKEELLVMLEEQLKQAKIEQARAQAKTLAHFPELVACKFESGPPNIWSGYLKNDLHWSDGGRIGAGAQVELAEFGESWESGGERKHCYRITVLP